MNEEDIISEEELKEIKELSKKRYTTMELSEPNMWGVWHDGRMLSTYEVTDKLNTYSIANEELANENEHMRSVLLRIVRGISAEHHRRYYECNVSLTKTDYKLLEEMINNGDMEWGE